MAWAALVIAVCFFWASASFIVLGWLLMRLPWGALASVAKVLSIGFSMVRNCLQCSRDFCLFNQYLYLHQPQQMSLSSKFQDDFLHSLGTAQRRCNCSYTQSQLTVKLYGFIRLWNSGYITCKYFEYIERNPFRVITWHWPILQCPGGSSQDQLECFQRHTRACLGIFSNRS